jgi:hypothetical protein
MSKNDSIFITTITTSDSTSNVDWTTSSVDWSPIYPSQTVPVDTSGQYTGWQQWFPMYPSQTVPSEYIDWYMKPKKQAPLVNFDKLIEKINSDQKKTEETSPPDKKPEVEVTRFQILDPDCDL